jgi:hypothetical protein
MADNQITTADLEAARAVFNEVEPRGVFYRAATELLRLALEGQTALTVAEALAVLLQTWNKTLYRFKKRTFNEEHFQDIERLWKRYQRDLLAYRQQTIMDLDQQETTKAAVVDIFKEFERVLGAVGAAKALHLLAPQLFPLWDDAITKGYSRRLRGARSNADRYWGFMLVAKEQCSYLSGGVDHRTLLKRIDEYNYCRYTLLNAAHDLYAEAKKPGAKKAEANKAEAVRKYKLLCCLAPEHAKKRIDERIKEFDGSAGDHEAAGDRTSGASST